MAKKHYRKHLAEILIEVGMINPIAMGNMLSRHRQTKKPLISILVESGLTTNKLLSYVMEQEYEFKHLDMERYVVPSGRAHIFVQLQENIDQGLQIELFPIPKSDFDVDKRVAEEDKSKGSPSHAERRMPLSLTIVSEDDFYNYVTDSRRVCMMCMNPLIIKNANSCYRLRKFTENKDKINNP